jgi:hypothetical protein
MAKWNLNELTQFLNIFENNEFLKMNILIKLWKPQNIFLSALSNVQIFPKDSNINLNASTK